MRLSRRQTAVMGLGADAAAAQLEQLAQVCRELAAARQAAAELEAQRNELISALRRAGRSCNEIATIADLTPGRVTQIAGALSPPTEV